MLRIINSHASVNPIRQRRVLHDGHPLVRAVGVLEEHHSRPVVGEVFREGARRARRLLRDVPFHGRVEGIAAYDLVQVRRRDAAWLDERVETLDGDGRAAEAQSCVRWGCEG